MFACIAVTINGAFWHHKDDDGSVVLVCLTCSPQRAYVCVCVSVKRRGASQAGMSALEKSITIWAHFIQRTEGREDNSQTRAHTCSIFHFEQRQQRAEMQQQQRQRGAPLVCRLSALSEHLSPALDPAAIKAGAVSPQAGLPERGSNGRLELSGGGRPGQGCFGGKFSGLLLCRAGAYLSH